MKTLSTYDSRNHNIRLYVPGTVSVNEAADDQQGAMVDRVLDCFADWFGGATIYPVHGAWKSDVAGLVKEKIVIVGSYATTEEVDEHLPKVIGLCEKIKEEMHQEAVALEYDNRLFFI